MSRAGKLIGIMDENAKNFKFPDVKNWTKKDYDYEVRYLHKKIQDKAGNYPFSVSFRLIGDHIKLDYMIHSGREIKFVDLKDVKKILSDIDKEITKNGV